MYLKNIHASLGLVPWGLGSAGCRFLGGCSVSSFFQSASPPFPHQHLTPLHHSHHVIFSGFSWEVRDLPWNCLPTLSSQSSPSECPGLCPWETRRAGPLTAQTFQHPWHFCRLILFKSDTLSFCPAELTHLASHKLWPSRGGKNANYLDLTLLLYVTT